MFVVNGRSHDERRSFDFFDGVDIFLNDDVRQRLVEIVCGCNDHVQSGVLDGQATGTGQSVQEVVSGFSFGLLILPL